LIAYLQEAVPFYQALPGIDIRLLRSVDRPGSFTEVIEYQTAQAFQADQKRIEEDGRMQRLLARWRTLLIDPPIVEHFTDITVEIFGGARHG
jgi:hypothetical protein